MAYPILEIIGYYKIKRNVKQRLHCRRLLREDKRRKQEALRSIEAMQAVQLKQSNNASDLIVSLTSYGIRVSDTLPYTLFSLLQQTRVPNRIIVWLDNENWNDDRLPSILKKLQTLGVEFYYVKDLRSYKKLIPALKKFPDNVIITVDDDWYYNEHTVEWLLKDYFASDQHTVFGTWGYYASETEGNYNAYNTWRNNTAGDNKEVSLIGCGAVLYPPHVFDEEIFNEALFMKLAPTADDLWFWAMEKRGEIKVKLCSVNGFGLHTAVNQIDIFKPDKEGSLYFINEINGKNDEQFFNLVSYYHLRPGTKTTPAV